MLETNLTKASLNNPFPGLRAFKGSESHLFFGREEHIADVLAKLDKNHFVAVVGTSGTGKSSLIKAGVLPAIEAGVKSDKGVRWEVITITPGSSPLQNLASAVAQKFTLVKPEDATALEKKLLDLMNFSTLGLVQAMRSVLEKNTRLLLLVDQFEEVFRFASEEDAEVKAEYDQFVKLLIDTVRQRDVPIYSILTLRSDFLGDCVAFEGLPEAINDGHYLVPRMTKAQMKRAITGPIEYAKGKISPRLVQHITNDLGTNPDQLPILQHAMMRCWEYWKKHEVVGEPMDLKHFEAIGDLDNALSEHADEAFGELAEAQQLLAEKIFKCLTTKKADNRGVRRPMALGHIMQVTQATMDEVLASMAPFQKAGRSFILPGTEVQPTETTIYDISHESLMRGWDRLKYWVDEEMESAEFYERICTAAVLYKQGSSALWRNPELQLAIDWHEKQHPIKAWGELYNENFELGIDFIVASRKADIEERKRKSARTRIIRISVASFIVVISILAAWALFQTNIANNKTEEAELKSKEALEQKKLAEVAKDQAQKASEEAEANKNIAEAQAKIAEDQANNAESQKRIAEEQRVKAEASAKDARNKQALADQKSQEAILQKQKADAARNDALRLRLIATSQNLAHESSQITRDPELAALLAITSFDIAAANNANTNDGTLYEAATKSLKQINKTYSPIVQQMPTEVLSLVLKNGEAHVADAKGMYYRLDAETYNPAESINTELKQEEINTAYINPIGKGFAYGLNSFVLKVYGDNENTLTGHSGLIRAAASRTANPVLVTGGRDNNVILWNADGTNDVVQFAARIKSIVVLPNANYCLVGCENGTTYKLNLQDKNIVVFATRQNVRVETIGQSENGETVAIGYSDGSTQIFNKTGALLKEVMGVGTVVSVKVDEKNNILAIASSGRLIAVYTLSNLNILPIEINLERPVKEMDIDHASGNLFVACTDRTIHRYAAQTDWYIEQLRKKVNRKLTQEEWETFVGTDIPYYAIKPEQINK